VSAHFACLNMHYVIHKVLKMLTSLHRPFIYCFLVGCYWQQDNWGF